MKETRAPPSLCSAFHSRKGGKTPVEKNNGLLSFDELHDVFAVSRLFEGHYYFFFLLLSSFPSLLLSFYFQLTLFPTPPSFGLPLCFRFLCGSDLCQNSSLERLLSTTITPYSAICIIRGTGVVILSSLSNFPRISYFWTRRGEERRNWRELLPSLLILRLRI